ARGFHVCRHGVAGSTTALKLSQGVSMPPRFLGVRDVLLGVILDLRLIPSSKILEFFVEPCRRSERSRRQSLERVCEMVVRSSRLIGICILFGPPTDDRRDTYRYLRHPEKRD